MIENEVRRIDVPDAYCHDCGIHLSEVNEFATYTRDGEKHYKCGECHAKDPLLRRKTEVYSRVCGYLRPVEQWHEAKRQEFRDRETYRVEA